MFPQSYPLPNFELPADIYDQIVGRRLHADSRRIERGNVFVACQGEYTDGRGYIADAVSRGAAFVFWDSDGGFVWQAEWNVPNLGVPNLSKQVGLLAAACYGIPGKQLSVWGITGTNGKTSVSQWLAQAADLLGKRCGIMGTVGNGYWQHLQSSTHTTLDAVSVQSWLMRFVCEGAKAVAMEVSSHGLEQHRVIGVPFKTAVFTNLTRDHLDYHGDMASYGESKAKLFSWQGLRHAVINIDDPFGRQLAAHLRSQYSELTVLSYGFAEDADICISHFQAAASGMNIGLTTPWGEGEVKTHLLGRFNAQNLAACVGVLCAEGFGLPEVLIALAQIHPATGRMDCLMGDNQPLIVVDYAHTPDALEKALSTLQEIKPKGAKLWCVFGCGGNRDRGKRPLMGAAAVSSADCVVITSDNPRREEPLQIIADILPAVPNPVLVEADRQLAIEYAVEHAGVSDVVLIAGKGHETYQDINGEKHHFSDFEAAAAALQKRNTH
ncbi:UDP-N-acetylmuramoyl-L-alanyl-D-glutamate--2,6-diaminopimelate ligase [Stenoxybacter acetivorans]|uniref:UDP-N-acetylmuramoyl-L-alanyl-D-glutamate--2, 6-diaminopimelate ligase n=1 Tax=Stenoxybacter acetivorans TaxID=422441 RepID=UPI00055DD172|nr:UDP-N-acetylmuramoyl-L-alanyl-D-glutamate--2,6-diaminopimelate ligase [Stenoxybacter acetivorans]